MGFYSDALLTVRLCHGQRFSISTSSEIERIVRIRTMSPRLIVFSNVSSVVTVLMISTAMSISSPRRMERPISSRICV
jgi:hypothetical protein